jgi:hypothetical protein
MIRVIRGGRSETQHTVVAGTLALDAQASRRIPDERIEPVKTTHDLNKDLR